MPLAPLSARFQSLPLLPTIKLGLSGAGSRVGGLVHTLGPCEAGSLSCCRPNPHGRFQSEVCLGCTVCFTPLCPVYLCVNVGPQSLLVVRLPAPFVPHSSSLGLARATGVLSAQLPVSTPPTGLDECLFFISLVSDFLAVRFSVSSGVYLCRHLSSL